MGRGSGDTSIVQGAVVEGDGVRFTVWSEAARSVTLCLFDDNGEVETDRIPFQRREGGFHSVFVPGAKPGLRYGFRADGDYDPSHGLWFDPDKLLMDPYAVEIDRPYVYDGRLAARRGSGEDTARLMPKAIVAEALPVVPHRKPAWQPGGLIYEIQVRAFTMRHPVIAPELRGTIAALAEPPVVEHLTRLGVSAVELMPVTAWIDERHLEPLGLTNAWGYNPVSFMALEPALAPGGMAELRKTVAALREAGIGVFLDVVFNHTGESDEHGPTLSLRGLDNQAYYRHLPHHPGMFVNDTGTGNTLACDHPASQRLVLDSLRHFVRHAGVDGFRFDLAPVLGRMEHGFDPHARLLRRMLDDPLLGDRVLIAEPWDVGPGGYQLGNFPDPFLEWNDRFRDDIRRFWRGDTGFIGALATRLAGSSEIFARSNVTRTVNFIAAHDGMTLADVVSYERRQNHGNGEHNHDGHHENFSWNNGVEGETDDEDVLRARGRDLRALLATLFASRGAIMLTAGDEFGRSQDGNNNAYSQDNEITWLDWNTRDMELEAWVCELSALRRSFPPLMDLSFFDGEVRAGGSPDVKWLRPDGRDMSVADWEHPHARCLCMLLSGVQPGDHLAIMINGSNETVRFHLPPEIGESEAAIVGHGGDEIAEATVVRERQVAFRRTRRD